MSKDKTFDLDGLSEKNDVETARELIDEICTLVGDLPEAADDFASSVEDITRDISAYIDEWNHVTKKQLTTLENMLDGIRGWLRD